MQNKKWLVALWIGIFVILAAMFPERFMELIKIKAFAFILVMVLFLLGFFIWLNLKNRE